MEKDIKKQRDKEQDNYPATTRRRLGREFPWSLKGACRIDHLLTWVYADQKAHMLGGGGRMYEGELAASGSTRWMEGTGLTSSHMIIQHEQLGCRIDTSANLGFDLHPVADAVHAWVSVLPLKVSGMVIGYAVAGQAPPLPRSFKPKVAAAAWRIEGQSAEVERTRVGRAEVSWCDVLVTCTRSSLLAAVDTYRTWAVQLNALADAVADDPAVSFAITALDMGPVSLARLRAEAEGVDFGTRLPPGLNMWADT